MITVYHIIDAHAAKVAIATFGKDFLKVVEEEWKNGHYRKVATVDGSNLENAFEKTNNIDNSWSKDENPGVKVEAPLHVVNGRTYGLRSSMIGDVFVLDESTAFVVGLHEFATLRLDINPT